MALEVDGVEIELRDATPADLPALLSLIRAMAAFERLAVQTTEEALHEALFGEEPVARAILVLADRAPVGYATYFFSFASMTGRRGLWLDDLFIDSAFRRRGIGRALVKHLSAVAQKSGCARMEWMVLDWNESAIEFYRRLGAEVLPDWRICRLEGERLLRAADRRAGDPMGPRS